jgi:hypothetical protein
MDGRRPPRRNGLYSPLRLSNASIGSITRLQVPQLDATSRYRPGQADPLLASFDHQRARREPQDRTLPADLRPRMDFRLPPTILCHNCPVL